MILDSKDPWGHFLHARKLLIDQLLTEGQTATEIANTLSMDTGQVTLIAMTPVQLDVIGVNYPVRTHLRPGWKVADLPRRSRSEQQTS